MPVSVCSAYQRYLRMLLPIKCHPLNPIPRARLWYVGNPHAQSGGFHHGSWGLVPSRYTNSPPPLPLPRTYDKPLRGNVAEEAFCQKPAPMGWVHCAAVPPLGAGPAWMTTGGRGRRLLVCRMFPFPKRGNWTKGSK